MSLTRLGDFPSGSVVKNLPAMQDTWVWSLGYEDPLEEGMAAHSSNLARNFPWTKEPGGLQSIRLPRVGNDWSNWACTACLELFKVQNEENRVQKEAGVHQLDDISSVRTPVPPLLRVASLCGCNRTSVLEYKTNSRALCHMCSGLNYITWLLCPNSTFTS